MPDKPNLYLESLRATRVRLEEKLKKPGLSPEARANMQIHLDGYGKPGDSDYVEGVIPAINVLEGKGK